MDAPASSRRRCRESSASGGRNVRPRCSTPDLVSSRRRRREAAAEATLAARVDAGCGRNQRLRLPSPPVAISGHPPAVSVPSSAPAAPPSNVVSSELN